MLSRRETIFFEDTDTTRVTDANVHRRSVIHPRESRGHPVEPIRSGVVWDARGSTLERSSFKSHGRGWESRIPTRSRHLHTAGRTTPSTSVHPRDLIREMEFCSFGLALYLSYVAHPSLILHTLICILFISIVYSIVFTYFII